MKTRFLAVAIALASLAARPAIGAEGTPLPWTYFADGGGGSGVDAVSSASKAPSPSGFLGFKDKEGFHRFSGWMSGGLLLASGIVGAAHAVGMMETAHEYRDSLGIDEYETGLCRAEIAAVYDDPTQQALRWTHVGLLAAGETFYLANALTGVDFMAPLPPGWSKSKIHRYAFFVHAGLMVAEGVLGFLSSDALQRGDHEAFAGLLAAHAGIGIAIPLAILGAGAIMAPGRSP
jgi:hypothetical protein